MTDDHSPLIEYFHPSFSLEDGNVLMHGLQTAISLATLRVKYDTNRGNLESAAAANYLGTMTLRLAGEVRQHLKREVDSNQDDPLVQETMSIYDRIRQQISQLKEAVTSLHSDDRYPAMISDLAWWYVDTMAPIMMLSATKTIKAMLDEAPTTNVDRIEGCIHAIATMAKLALDQAHCSDADHWYQYPDSRQSERQRMNIESHQARKELEDIFQDSAKRLTE